MNGIRSGSKSIGVTKNALLVLVITTTTKSVIAAYVYIAVTILSLIAYPLHTTPVNGNSYGLL